MTAVTTHGGGHREQDVPTKAPAHLWLLTTPFAKCAAGALGHSSTAHRYQRTPKTQTRAYHTFEPIPPQGGGGGVKGSPGGGLGPKF